MKYKLIVFSMLPIFAMAINNTQSNLKLDNSKVSPAPDAEIRVEPIANMDLPENLKNEELNRLSQQKELGYSKTNNLYAIELLNSKTSVIQDVKSSKLYAKNPYDTHFKKSLSEIKLAFNFKGLKNIKTEDVLAFTPTGTWIKDGWTGISEFFNSEIGVCHFKLDNMKLTHGSTIIMEEAARYDINKNPNTLSVSGSIENGFLYNISWYDNNRFHKELECANMKYDEQFSFKLINLAKEIEKTL